MKLEVVVLPVSDVDRAKQFYEALGWRLDADFAIGEDFRIVQLTPPGSACSIIIRRRVSRRPRRARRRVSISSSPTSRPPAPSSSATAST